MKKAEKAAQGSHERPEAVMTSPTMSVYRNMRMKAATMKMLERLNIAFPYLRFSTSLQEDK